MDLLKSRRGSTSVDPHPLTTESTQRASPSLDLSARFEPTNSRFEPPTPRLTPGLLNSTPKPSPRFPPHHRKNSSGNFTPSPSTSQGIWSYLVRGPPQPAGLPGVGRRGPTNRDEPTRGQILRNLVLRPLYIFSRRGPFVPVTVVSVLLLLYLAYSTNAHSLRVRRRMQGAMKPYIPERAAAALNWREAHQQPLGSAANRDPAVVKPIRKPLARIKPSKASTLTALPEQRTDGRIPLVVGKKHPIPLLMLQARKKWEVLKGKQSKTFAGAVREYQSRYGRKPPKGFDLWYAFAKAHKVLLIDEFDLISNDLKIFRAFSPETFRARVAELRETFETTWTIRVKNGKPLREGELAHHDRAIGVVDLMKRFVHLLPDMQIVYNGHDGARIALTHEERARLEGLAATGQFDEATKPFYPTELGPEPHHSMPVFCPPDSAVRAEGFDYGWPNIDATGYEMPPLIDGSAGALLVDYKGYMDVCTSPQYRHFHATTSWVYAHHPTPVLPLFTPGVQPRFGDIHSLIVEQLDLRQEHNPTWEERPFTMLQWRGQTSGPLWDAGVPWKSTQRARLHLLSHQEMGSRKIVITDDEDVMRAVEVPNYRLNPLFLDVGMVGPAVQCVQEDGTCDKMFEVFQGYDKRISFDRASLYKYVLDVDGNSWSGRFRRLMMSNAAVVKTTMFPEFWTDWAVPWLHFIPMQLDYSDMWDILAFFRGGINGEGAHDDLGKEIAEAGKAWVDECYRWADLEAYQYRLMLEYGRLYTDETAPGSNDFDGDDTVEPVWPGTVKLER